MVQPHWIWHLGALVRTRVILRSALSPVARVGGGSDVRTVGNPGGFGGQAHGPASGSEAHGIRLAESRHPHRVSRCHRDHQRRAGPRVGIWEGVRSGVPPAMAHRARDRCLCRVEVTIGGAQHGDRSGDPDPDGAGGFLAGMRGMSGPGDGHDSDGPLRTHSHVAAGIRGSSSGIVGDGPEVRMESSTQRRGLVHPNLQLEALSIMADGCRSPAHLARMPRGSLTSGWPIEWRGKRIVTTT